MTKSSYLPPLDQLLTYGECKLHKWPNYVEKIGLTAEHIPDLIRIATDSELNWADSESLEVWAPVHAWRALGQLKAEAAIEPLLAIAEEMEDSDWYNEELPEVFALIGAAAIPALESFLANSSHPFYPRITTAHCLAEIGQANPDARADCVAVLTKQLAQFMKTSPELNGFLVSYLMDLVAVESAPIMEQAFAAKRVDPSIAGDWIDVQRELGMISRAEAHQLRTVVDAEHIRSIAAKPSQPPQGFGAGKPTSTKKKKKK